MVLSTASSPPELSSGLHRKDKAKFQKPAHGPFGTYRGCLTEPGRVPTACSARASSGSNTQCKSPWLVVGLSSLPLPLKVRIDPSLTLVCVTAPTERRPIVISGPSGVGKGTLCQRLLDAYPETFATTVSHTTRKPRPGEVEGSAYYFVSREKFESLIAESHFIEFAEFNGNLYGTSKQTVID